MVPNNPAARIDRFAVYGSLASEWRVEDAWVEFDPVDYAECYVRWRGEMLRMRLGGVHHIVMSGSEAIVEQALAERRIV